MASQTPTDIEARSTEAGWSPYRITVDQYLAMIGSGIFRDDTHVELMGGVLVQPMTKFAPHNFAVSQTGVLLSAILPDSWMIREEKSLVLGRFWRPEPDLAIVRGPNEQYRTRDPEPSDVGLLIEVAESSYPYDRGSKWRAYAATRIPTYWILNLAKRQVEVYGDPNGRGKTASYGEVATYGPDVEVPVVLDHEEVGRIPVIDILP